ncbi:MAG: hypothetical protein ACO3QX_06460, partial [Ilumatobacteraceae bacterium]
MAPGHSGKANDLTRLNARAAIQQNEPVEIPVEIDRAVVLDGDRPQRVTGKGGDRRGGVGRRGLGGGGRPA